MTSSLSFSPPTSFLLLYRESPPTGARGISTRGWDPVTINITEVIHRLGVSGGGNSENDHKTEYYRNPRRARQLISQNHSKRQHLAFRNLIKYQVAAIRPNETKGGNRLALERPARVADAGTVMEAVNRQTARLPGPTTQDTRFMHRAWYNSFSNKHTDWNKEHMARPFPWSKLKKKMFYNIHDAIRCAAETMRALLDNTPATDA